MDARAVEQRRLLAHGRTRVGLTPQQLWVRYFALGGEVGPMEVEAHLAGAMPLPAAQGDLLAHALNEHAAELLVEQRVPYSFDLAGGAPRRPLAGLVGLLRGSHGVSPDRLTVLADEAARALDVRIAIHLVDPDQQQLIPSPLQVGGTRRDGRPLDVDGTAAGRAYRRGEPVPRAGKDVGDDTRDGSSGWWLPLLAGAQRVGVLEVEVPDRADIADAALRDQCEALAAALAHILVVWGALGEAHGAVRRRPRSPAQELLGRLLPDSSAATGTVAVAGSVLPGHAGSGAFDYSLSADRVHLAVLEADMGPTAAPATALALTACRLARHRGDDLAVQAGAIDAALAGPATAGARVTGVLVELDPRTGEVRHLNAGQPPPLVLRDGTVIAKLDGPERVPFGDPDRGRAPAAPVGRASLQPGDRLVLHSHGLAGARDSSGVRLGERQLAELLEGAATDASGAAAVPETVRLLGRAVLSYAGGSLEHDATILLVARR